MKQQSEPTVLVIAGRQLERLVKTELDDQSLRVLTEADEPTLREIVDVAVLDATDDSADALDRMYRLRESRDRLPVVVLVGASARDRIRLIDLGADDALSVPFVPEELTSRVRALVRRSTITARDGETLEAPGGLIVDFIRRAAYRDGQYIPLTKTEWTLLFHLASNAGKVMLSSELLSKIWGADHADDFQYLRVWIGRLRRKLELDAEDPQVLRTVQGVGYVFHAVGVEDEAAIPAGTK